MIILLTLLLSFQIYSFLLALNVFVANFLDAQVVFNFELNSIAILLKD